MAQKLTTEQITEHAADCVLRAHGFFNTSGTEILATDIETLGWALGERITYEQGLPDLVKAAIAIERRQHAAPLAVLVEAAGKWRDELDEYIIPAAKIPTAGEESDEYQAEKDRIDAAILALTEGN
ncbi:MULTISPECIES: hypothetical protein [unclassified Leucobacter]|uniref:hypothetical protein n=1 Tax=unclassified Leucobacter TaxID=2621730 RepID=UPI003019100C